jgi:ribosomal protein L16/L10AE
MILKYKLLKMFKDVAQVWLRYTPQKPLFYKSGGVRMGKGKGEFLTWVAPLKAGDILFEISKFILTKQLKKKLMALLSNLAGTFKFIKLGT